MHNNMCITNGNAVRGRLSENYYRTKYYIGHEIFTIYGTRQ